MQQPTESYVALTIETAETIAEQLPDGEIKAGLQQTIEWAKDGTEPQICHMRGGKPDETEDNS